jgi:hypothetical protein
MQNKPNFLNAQMNVTSFVAKDYENKSNWRLGENKANQTQFQRQKNPQKNRHNTFLLQFRLKYCRKVG